MDLSNRAYILNQRSREVASYFNKICVEMGVRYF